MIGRRRSRRSARPRVAVYAIARDEEAHVERWAASARDADLILLADTGSTDATVRRARALGVKVHDIRIEPFRYDIARNRALDLLPRDVDVCVSLDLDEVLVPGWREYLDDAWRDGATRARCWVQWRWSETYPPLRFSVDRIHARRGYRWRFPVHEQIVSVGAERVVASAVEIRHLRDPAGTRSAYLDLLRLGATEHPDDGRLAHMLANEARLNGRPDEARDHARRALALRLEPNERLHAMLMLSWLEPESRETWLLDACAEFPHRREPWCELAQRHLDRGHWRACRAAAHAALRIDQPADDYLANPFAWGPWPERLAAQASLELGDHDWANHHARRALAALPHDADLAALLHRATAALTPGRPARPPENHHL